MRWLSVAVAESVRREALIPLLVPMSSDPTGLMPEKMENEITKGQACPSQLLLQREGAWVEACFKMDNRDQLLATNMMPFVRMNDGFITKRGTSAICVEGPPCVLAIQQYHDVFVDEGCKDVPANAPDFKLATALQRTATACARFGQAAELDQTRPKDGADATSQSVAALSQHGCYHDYPACVPHCLDFPAKPTFPGGQAVNELYMVQQTCYLAARECVGCLFDPPHNPDELEPWSCPDTKCDDSPKFEPADIPVTSQAECKPSCDGFPACGHDGCGGHCGNCGETEECIHASCVYRPYDRRFLAPTDRGSDAPPPWWKRYGDQTWVDHAYDERNEKISRQVLKDWYPAPGRQGMGAVPTLSERMADISPTAPS